MKSLRPILAVVIVGVVCLLCGSCWNGCNSDYSDGEWRGTVTKLSHKGLMFKSWEGEINCGGTREESNGKTTSIVPNVVEFNAPEEVVPQLKAALSSGQPVVLTYRQWMIAPIRISNDHVVQSVGGAKP